MNKKSIVLLLVLAWVLVIVTSILMSVNIEGPRNIDTGFKRLDTLFRGQIIAFAIAIVAAISVFLVKDIGKGLKLLGLAPLGLTILVVGGFILVFAVLKPGAPPSGYDTTPKPVTIAPDEVTPSD